MMKQHASTCLLRLPASPKAAVTECGKEYGTGVHQLVAAAIAEKVSAMRTTEFLAERGDEGGIDAARRLPRRGCGQPPEDGDRLT